MAYYDVIYDVPRVYNLVVKNSGEFYVGISVPNVSDEPLCRPTISLTNNDNFVMYDSMVKTLFGLIFMSHLEMQITIVAQKQPYLSYPDNT